MCEEDVYEKREKREERRDRQINRQKSFIHIRYNNEQYSKLNSIESNGIETI